MNLFYWPAGQITGASADGRYSGDCFADGGLSPVGGTDKGGPLTVLNSALHINQDNLQAVLLNMKMSPSCMKTPEDLRKFGQMVKTYLCNGGKHIQFNVVNKAQLLEAQEKPEENSQLMVRIAGYSTYFLALNKAMQREVISRTDSVSLNTTSVLLSI